MAQGRGFSAIIFFFCLLVLCCDMAHATTYVVGDKVGWMFNITDWTKGKKFKAGDTLVFNYDPLYHDVVIVDEAGYNSCTAPKGSTTYQSGHDHIKLAHGTTYFICTSPRHCIRGMKIAVYASCRHKNCEVL